MNLVISKSSLDSKLDIVWNSSGDHVKEPGVQGTPIDVIVTLHVREQVRHSDVQSRLNLESSGPVSAELVDDLMRFNLTVGPIGSRGIKVIDSC